jgi:hypothetical protein
MFGNQHCRKRTNHEFAIGYTRESNAENRREHTKELEKSGVEKDGNTRKVSKN